MIALLQRLDVAGETRSYTGWGLRGQFRLLPQISRYAVVSVLALALDYAAYLTLVAFGTRAVLAGVAGYALGLLLHFLLSSLFVFHVAAVQKTTPRLFGEFALSGLVGLAITAAVIAAATDAAGLAPLPAKILATGVSFVVVYGLRHGIVFAAPRA